MAKSEEIIRYVQKAVKEPEFREKHVFEPEKQYVRQRKMSFSDTMMYILGNTREPVELATMDYCERSGKESISAAAVCKARAKIKYTALEEIFKESAKIIPVTKRYNGYQVIAVDGMDGELPKTAEFMKKYRRGEATEYPLFHAIAAYDVMNEIFVAAYFDGETSNERAAAIRLLDDEYFKRERILFLMDRGFPSLELIQKLNELGMEFVLRVSRSFLKEVNGFTQGSAVDEKVSISYTKRRGAVNRVNANLPDDFELRCVRVRLNSGEDEICITNLDAEEFPTHSIKELYGMRWGIEGAFNYLKNAVFIEEFTSKSENGVKQDFYATLWSANMINLISTEALQKKPI